MIVDNKSAGGSRTTLHEAMSGLANFELYELTANAGYFGAAKAGLDRFLEGNKVVPDWVIVCNHDVLIEDPDFFSKLFSQDPMAVGVIAPRIQALPAGVEQNPFMSRRPGWLRWGSLRCIYSNYGTASIWDWLSRQKKSLKSLIAARAPKSSSNGVPRRQSIYAPYGAFLIFGRKYFEAGGYLDGNLFLYGEEIAVAEICRTLHLPVVYQPSLCVLHNEHRSTGHGISRFTYECQRDALRYVTSRYLSGSGGPVESGTEPQALMFLKK
ncbi:MAG: glycosyltransferase family 2 protein [Candidatus Acidiferrales bacterium]